MLKRFNILDSKRGLLPFRHGIHLSKTMSPKTSKEITDIAKVLYASAIGSLMYAMLCTRPDIAFAFTISVTKEWHDVGCVMACWKSCVHLDTKQT